MIFLLMSINKNFAKLNKNLTKVELDLQDKKSEIADLMKQLEKRDFTIK